MVGAAMSFRREALLAVGGFDPSLGRTATGAAGCEETELCLRLAAHRPEARIVYEPAAVVDHLVPVTRARLGYLVRRCWGEGRSKARVAGLAGAARATSAERDYVRRVLPAALLRSVAGSLRLRAGSAAGGLVVLVALLTTTFGYLTGRVRT